LVREMPVGASEGISPFAAPAATQIIEKERSTT
jgi:hypothetical protein